MNKKGNVFNFLRLLIKNTIALNTDNKVMVHLSLHQRLIFKNKVILLYLSKRVAFH
jgi:hypothetical protein